MKTLFIDTHSETLRMAIVLDGNVVLEEKESNRSHSEIAIPTLESVLNKANIILEEIDEIIVVNGPGSFTGVRIGVTIAKTIAYSLNKPIKTITSLEAYGVSDTNSFDIVTVKDSKGVYFARKVGNEFVDFSYMKNSDFKAFIGRKHYSVCSNTKIDVLTVIDYLKGQKSINPHSVNPVYIKEIDALK